MFYVQSASTVTPGRDPEGGVNEYNCTESESCGLWTLYSVRKLWLMDTVFGLSQEVVFCVDTLYSGSRGLWTLFVLSQKLWFMDTVFVLSQEVVVYGHCLCTQSGSCGLWTLCTQSGSCGLWTLSLCGFADHVE